MMSHEHARRPEDPKHLKAATTEVEDLSCDLQRSARYHRARARFFEGWSNLFSFLSLVAGSSVVVALLAHFPSWIATAFGALVAAVQLLDQVLGLASKARDHSGFASEFVALERVMIMNQPISERLLCDLRADVLAIEAREPPIKRYLDLICHNQVARAIGSNDVEKLTWWQRWFAQYLNGDTALQ